MFKLLRSVRRAIKQWRALPPDEQDRYKDHVARIRSLVAELGGAHALGYVEGAGDSEVGEPEDAAPASRPRAEALAELQQATMELLAALSAPATELVKDAMPLSARVGAKVAGKGFRRISRR